MGDRRRQRGRSAVGALIGALTGLGLLAAGFIGLRLWEEGAALRASPSDNVQRTFPRLEAVLLQFRRAAAQAATGEVTPAEMRRAFHLLHSRIRTLEQGGVFAAQRGAGGRPVARPRRRLSRRNDPARGRAGRRAARRGPRAEAYQSGSYPQALK